MKKGLFESLLNEMTGEFQSNLTKNSQSKPRNKGRKAKNTNKVRNTQTVSKVYDWEKRDERLRDSRKQVQTEKKPDMVKKAEPRIKMTRAEMRKGIIYSEILGKPKSIR